MDLIYKIYSVYLYDTQLEHEWLILHNKYKSSFFLHSDESTLGFSFGQALNEIHNLPKKKKGKSIDIIKDVMKNEKDKLLIRNDGFLTIDKIENTRDPKYSIYDIYWNETKSGINITEYDYCSIYNKPSPTCAGTSTSCYRIFEEKRNRLIAMRGFNLESILK